MKLSLALRAACGALLLAAWPLVARPVTPAEARQAAVAWVQAHTALLPEAETAAGEVCAVAGEAAVVAERSAAGEALYYAVPLAGERAWLAVAGDTRLEPVLAVVDGRVEAAAASPMRSLLRADAAGRLAALAAAEGEAARLAAATDPTAGPRTRWAELLGSADGVQVQPLAGTNIYAVDQIVSYIRAWKRGGLNHWNQNATNNYLPTVPDPEPLYNYYTPGHYPSGCVATAGAAVLEFLQVPGAPAGVQRLCALNGYSAKLETIGGAYNWACMPAWQAWSTEVSAEARELIGRVVYDLGVLLGMHYTPGASDVSTAQLAQVFREDYGLDGTRWISIGGAEDYEPVIYAPLWRSQPVILSIKQENDVGHAVVAVGYAEVGGVAYVRLFMGYGGMNDGWYALPDIPGYTRVAGAVTNIGRKAEPTLSLYGRVQSATGTAAVGVPVEVLGQTAITSTLGTFSVGVREADFPSSAEPLALVNVQASAPGTSTTLSCFAGISALTDGSATTLFGEAQTGLGYLPRAFNLTLPAEAFLPTVRVVPSTAQVAASRQGRMIVLVAGPLESAEAVALRKRLYELEAAAGTRAILCLSDENLGVENWRSPGLRVGLFDARLFTAGSSWEENGAALLGEAASLEALAQLHAGARLITARSCPDAVPGAWLRQHFGTLPESDAQAEALADEDSDGDGFTNAQEYVLGTDPRDAASRFTFGPFAAQDDGSLRPTFEQSAPGRSYTLQGKRTLGEAWAEPDAKSRFFRVSVSF